MNTKIKESKAHLYYFLIIIFLSALPKVVFGSAQHDKNKNTINYQDASETIHNKDTQMKKMIKMLDQLDKIDFQDALSQAKDNIKASNYRDAENSLSKASSFANDNEDYYMLKKIKNDLIAKIKFDNEINNVRMHIFSRNFHKASTTLKGAPKYSRSTEDQLLLSAIQNELSREIKLQKSEDRAQREYEQEKRRLARMKREATYNEPVIDDSNKWYGTATSFIQDVADGVSKAQQESYERSRKRLSAKNSRNQQAKIKQQQRELDDENSLRQQKSDQERQARVRNIKIAEARKKKTLAAIERALDDQKRAAVKSPDARPQISPQYRNEKLSGYTKHGTDKGVSLYYKTGKFGVTFKIENATNKAVDAIIFDVKGDWKDNKTRMKSLNLYSIPPGKIRGVSYDQSDNYSELKSWSFERWSWSN